MATLSVCAVGLLIVALIARAAWLWARGWPHGMFEGRLEALQDEPDLLPNVYLFAPLAGAALLAPLRAFAESYGSGGAAFPFWSTVMVTVILVLMFGMFTVLKVGQFRMPGPDGSYRDSCVLCLAETDTGLGFGPAEAQWAMAGLGLLGLSERDTVLVISEATGCEPGNVPDGDVTVVVRVCASCMAGSELEAAGMVLGSAPQVPVYAPR